MKKTEIKININDFPRELHYIFENAKIYDSSSHPTMTVLYSGKGNYDKGVLKKVAEIESQA